MLICYVECFKLEVLGRAENFYDLGHRDTLIELMHMSEPENYGIIVRLRLTGTKDCA
ncbi:hypothetical protein [Corynebacterium pseudodiphtheriticum]|uniref:hypothetical protein n=1 Tax=Corynebacterium pseudodiphtheriticum TaxID=37637 RepID=UPI002542DA98|nr:hypothetical protein [Corynebacterium pseudodiphtheriticum]MDK4229062.1 hypothetical protein [Corynebacterium pseudodiphtheriticum]